MKKSDDSVRISIHAHPGAKRNEVVRFEEGIWYLKIAAPPTQGKANKELIDFLSDLLGIGKSRIVIEKGLTGRRKRVLVQGLTAADIHDILVAAIA